MTTVCDFSISRSNMYSLALQCLEHLPDHGLLERGNFSYSSISGGIIRIIVCSPKNESWLCVRISVAKVRRHCDKYPQYTF